MFNKISVMKKAAPENRYSLDKSITIQDLSLTVRSENILDLMSNHILNRLTSRLEVLARIEVIRVLSKVLTDVTCHSKTDIGVDVDLADCKGSCLTELLFRNTYSIRHVTAVLVNHLNEFLRNGRRTVKYDREARELLHALFENVETERRRYENTVLVSCALCSCELISTVGSTDSNSEGVAACSAYELFNFFRTCVGLVTGLYNNFILDTCESTKLSLNYYAMSVSILNDLLSKSDVVLERLGGSVDHNRCETTVDAGFAEFERITVVKVQSDRDIRILSYGSLNEFYEIGVVSICSCTLGNLEDNRALQFACSFCDTLNDLHVVYVKSTYSVTAVICLFEHFSSSN